MQWGFLVLALISALIELNTGTFYLAAVAAAALVTAVLGVWIRDDLLIVVFLLLCAVLLSGVTLLRRKWSRRRPLADFDIGQRVSVRSVSPHGDRLLVTYRGTEWEAVMDDHAALTPGDTAIIASKTDKLLHLVSPHKAAQT